MALAEQLASDLKESLRSGDKLRTDVIRMARAAIQSATQERTKQRYDAAVQAGLQAGLTDEQAAVQAQQQVSAEPLDDAAILDVLAKEVKRRRDAVDAYSKANRPDLAQTEEREAHILEGYLPRRLSAEELRPLVQSIMTELGVQGQADMGRLMPVLMERLKSQAEGRVINQVARELLSGK